MLTDRIALVTGGSRGIGKAAAEALQAAGATVAVNYLRNPVEGFAAAVQADVSQAHEVTRMVREVEERFGRIDILVNNAGMAVARTVAEVTEEDWDLHLAVNLKSVFLVTQAVLPGMRERRWGRLINLGSVAAQTGGVVGPHYAASKAGIVGLTHAYALQLVKEGITANVVAPALIETDMAAALPNAQPERIPVGRLGTADDVAQAVVMLAGNAFITGQTINVNGGLYFTS